VGRGREERERDERREREGREMVGRGGERKGMAGGNGDGGKAGKRKGMGREREGGKGRSNSLSRNQYRKTWKLCDCITTCCMTMEVSARQ
jgi:hypothetical protein